MYFRNAGMRTEPLGDGDSRVFLSTDEYETLLAHAYSPQSRTTRQVRLEMRLMASSLRVETVSELRRDQVRELSTRYGDVWTLRVEAKNTGDGPTTRPRIVVPPQSVIKDLHQYADRNNISAGDRLFHASKRTIQRDVKRSADNAAIATGDEDFKKVTAHDLRRYFATHLLYRHEVRPEIVRALGGWKSRDAMYEYLSPPADTLVDGLSDAITLGSGPGYDKLGRTDRETQVTAAVDQLVALAEEGDEAAREQAITALQDALDDVDGVTVKTSADGSADVTPSGGSRTPPPGEQLSFLDLSDDKAAANPLTVAKTAYYAAVVATAWTLGFGAPM